MGGFFNAVSAVLLLLMLMSVGYGLGCLGWMTAAEKRFLSKFVVNIAVPLNCVVGLLNNLKREDLLHAGIMMAAAVAGIGLTLLLGGLAANWLKLPRNRWGVFVAMAGTSNTMFIGLPLTTQLFGDACLPYLMIYYLSSVLFTQTLVVFLIERAGNKTPSKISVVSVVLDLARKPPVLGVLTGVCLLALNLRPPELLLRFAEYMSATVTPLALLYCGFILYEVGLKNLRLLRGLPTMLVIRLVISPAICVGFCQLFGLAGLARSVFIVEAALPVVTQITVMAGAFGADEEYAAIGSAWSMLGCFFTIPVLMWWLG